jgi:hypothetical protein
MVHVPDPLRLFVGGYYDSGIQRWPQAELILTSEGCLLLTDRIAPTPEQIDEFETAEAQFAWLDARHNGLLSYRFGDSPWDYVPFNPHVDTPPGTRPGIPAVAPRQHLTVQIGLAGIDRTPVLAVRTVQWPEHFTSVIGATIRRLAEQPFDPASTRDEAISLHCFVGVERLVQRANIRCRSSN